MTTKNEKINKNVVAILNAIAHSEYNEVGGATPKTTDQAGMPFIDVSAWAIAAKMKVTAARKAILDAVAAGYLALVDEAGEYAPAGTIPKHEDAYCHMTAAGFKFWTKNVKQSKKDTNKGDEEMATKKNEKKGAKKTTKKAAKETKAKEAPKAAAKETKTGRPKKDPQEKKNGVAKPRPGTVCAEVWGALDELAKKSKKGVSRKDGVAALVDAKFDKGTAGVQYRRWAIFNGCYKKVR